MMMAQHQRQVAGSMPVHPPAPPANVPLDVAVITRAAPTIGFLRILFVGKPTARTTVRKLKLVLCPSLVSAALLVGLCQASLGQGDADLEAPGLAPFPPALSSGAATLFQNVRIF